ncbi:hypothetical protein FRC17_007858, partial [Serendipita sp. 399]
KEGKLGHCLIGDLFEEFGKDGDARDAVANLYFAGIDTTTSVVTSFLLVLFVFPDVAKKVQAEIDALLDQGGLPTVKDRTRLTYTEAVWKESIRWRPTVPNGYMLVDPKTWGDPEVFRPERHLPSHNPDAESLPNPAVLAFGFGARTCPGMYFADRTGFHLVLTLISLFDLLPPIGKSRLSPDDIVFTRGIFMFPTNFQVRFVPRNEKAAAFLSAMNVAASD